MNKEFKKVREVPLQFIEGWYYHTIWYFPIPPHPQHLLGGNTMGLIWRLEEEPGQWRMTYRMRYSNSTDISDPKDIRNWYGIHAVGDDAPEKLLAAARHMFEVATPLAFGGTIPNEPNEFDWIEIKGDHHQAMRKIGAAKKAWMHLSTRTGPEAEKLAKEMGLI